MWHGTALGVCDRLLNRLLQEPWHSCNSQLLQLVSSWTRFLLALEEDAVIRPGSAYRTCPEKSGVPS